MLRAKSSMQHQRVGIIGIGAAGLQHARAVIHCGHSVDAVAVECSTSNNIKYIKDIAPDARIIVGHEVLIEDDSLDAFVVALPWDIIPKVLPDLLKSNKPMLIEKPIGLTASEIETALAKNHMGIDSKLIGFNRRFYDVVSRLKTRLDKGGLKSAHIIISEDIGRQKTAHGDTIVPHLISFSSSHTLDLAVYLLGTLSIVKLYGWRDKSQFISINGLLETEQGLPTHLSLNASDPSSVGLRFIFSDSTTWVLSPLEMLSVFDRYEIVEISQNSKIRRYMPHVSEIVNEPVDYKPGFMAQMDAFLSGNFGPGASVHDALNTQKFIESIQSSANVNLREG